MSEYYVVCYCDEHCPVKYFHTRAEAVSHALNREEYPQVVYGPNKEFIYSTEEVAKDTIPMSIGFANAFLAALEASKPKACEHMWIFADKTPEIAVCHHCGKVRDEII